MTVTTKGWQLSTKLFHLLYYIVIKFLTHHLRISSALKVVFLELTPNTAK